MNKLTWVGYRVKGLSEKYRFDGFLVNEPELLRELESEFEIELELELELDLYLGRIWNQKKLRPMSWTLEVSVLSS